MSNVNSKTTIVITTYSIHLTEELEFMYVEMPEGSTIIHFDNYKIWARIDFSKPIVKRRIVVLRDEVPIMPYEIGTYIGTVYFGPHIRHLFDCGVTKTPEL